MRGRKCTNVTGNVQVYYVYLQKNTITTFNPEIGLISASQAHRVPCRIIWKHRFNVFISSFSQMLHHFEPPHYNHSDSITKPKQAYGYDPEGAVRVLCRTAHIHAHTATFPRLNRCQIWFSQQEITGRSWGRSFLWASDPLNFLLVAAVLCISTAHETHRHTFQ